MGLGERNSSGVGYIILPKGTTKEDYLVFCKNSGTISVLLDDGGIVDGARITVECFRDIYIPSSHTELGSAVFWVNLPTTNQIVVTGVLLKGNEKVDSTDTSLSIERKSNGVLTQVLLDALLGKVTITSISELDTGGEIEIVGLSKDGGRVSIKTNKAELLSSSLSIVLKESFKLQVINRVEKPTSNFSLSYIFDEGLELIDEWENKIEMLEDGIILNGGELGGLIKIQELVSRLNTIENKLNTLIEKYNKHTHISNSPGNSNSPTTLQETSISITKVEDIEDNKVKH